MSYNEILALLNEYGAAVEGYSVAFARHTQDSVVMQKATDAMHKLLKAVQSILREKEKAEAMLIKVRDEIPIRFLDGDNLAGAIKQLASDRTDLQLALARESYKSPDEGDHS